jgi:hypothetical protein
MQVSLFCYVINYIVLLYFEILQRWIVFYPVRTQSLGTANIYLQVSSLHCLLKPGTHMYGNILCTFIMYMFMCVNNSLNALLSHGP